MSKDSDVIKQLESLEKFTDIEKDFVIDESWKAQLKQIIVTHIDENSPFLKRVDEIKFSVTSIGRPSEDFFIKQYNQNKTDASLLIFNIKTFIENNGLKKRPNFICRLSEGWAIFLSGIVFVSWGGVCFWFGQLTTQNKIDKEKINLEMRINSLRTTIPLTIPTNLDTTKHIKIPNGE